MVEGQTLQQTVCLRSVLKLQQGVASLRQSSTNICRVAYRRCHAGSSDSKSHTTSSRNTSWHVLPGLRLRNRVITVSALLQAPADVSAKFAPQLLAACQDTDYQVHSIGDQWWMVQ
jgi:hypothetical protein